LLRHAKSVEGRTMIGFNDLGKMGRLGNQMFQYAALKGIATNRSFRFCIPPTGHALFSAFNLRVDLGLVRGSTIRAETFSFDARLFSECPDNVSLCGYFQTEKYFAHICNDIKRDFTFSKQVMSRCRAYLSQYVDPLSVHVRRGDYVGLSDYHYNLNLDYYVRALAQFDPDRPVLLFSDDIAWCLQHPFFGQARFIPGLNETYSDLCLMTLCHGHVIANSSYSWWGAYLSSSPKVVAPARWFGAKYAHLDISDICPGHWTRVAS
jgi:glycosyl transferase family 11